MVDVTTMPSCWAHCVLPSIALQRVTSKQHVPYLHTSWPNICSMSLAADAFLLARINTGYYIQAKENFCFLSEDQENLEPVFNHLVVPCYHLIYLF